MKNTTNNTEELLYYFIDNEKLSFKKNEHIFLNISDYFIEMIEDKKNREEFYTRLFAFINNMSHIKEINATLETVEREYKELLEATKRRLSDDELVLKARGVVSDERRETMEAFEEKEKEYREVLRQKNTFLNFFNKNFYFLLNNIYYNYKLVREMFIKFLEGAKNDDFITIVIEHSKRRLNKELLIDIIKHYNINKTHVNIIISMNINELTILILNLHEDKILKYNEIFNTCFFSSEDELKKILMQKDNKYIKYISEYLKRNNFED